MATFKVGQKVRVRKDVGGIQPGYEYLQGMETRIIDVGLDGYFDWSIDIIGRDGKPLGAMSRILEPIIDPDADAFIERIKKIAREPINLKDPNRETTPLQQL